MSFQLDPCVWVKCIDPVAPPGLHLQSDNDSTPVSFNSDVSFSCEDGYVFDEDPSMTSFGVTCLPGGSFDYPANWSRCIHPSSTSIYKNLYCSFSSDRFSFLQLFSAPLIPLCQIQMVGCTIGTLCSLVLLHMVPRSPTPVNLVVSWIELTCQRPGVSHSKTTR